MEYIIYLYAERNGFSVGSAALVVTGSGIVTFWSRRRHRIFFGMNWVHSELDIIHVARCIGFTPK